MSRRRLTSLRMLSAAESCTEVVFGDCLLNAKVTAPL